MQGIARQRQAIVNGLRESVVNFEGGVKVSPQEVIELMMVRKCCLHGLQKGDDGPVGIQNIHPSEPTLISFLLPQLFTLFELPPCCLLEKQYNNACMSTVQVNRQGVCGK
jgi:hypothetical protein